MRERLGVAIVGGGFAAASHLDALRRVEAATPLGIVTSTPERSHEAADRLGVERAYDTLEDLLGDHEVDVVHNCTPNHLHHAVTSAALDAGKHVLSEKPLAFDLEHAEDLAARAQAALNRTNSKVKLDVSEVERTLGMTAKALIPSDIVVPQTVNKGVPLVLDAPKTDVAKAFEKLADLFSSVDADVPIGKPKGRFGRF